ncbi:AzlC family ABC transporter permease [Desulfovibrio inopinatus]|uniref:AzlC family ABC transporter permease n=1 Tax=Desulfovibrio inopinatus TaxID=102109 RepID=UPI000411453D|nr:AzlC family ABC transporter permease [Desulfovibrio inopinatus]
MSPSPEFIAAFRAGARSVFPALPGLVPFALICGVTAMKAQVPGYLASFMSLTVFAGASQLAALELFSAGAPLAVVVMTGLVINLRFVMYSASITPHLQNRTLFERILMAYVLTDQGYALSVIRFEKPPPLIKPDTILVRHS